MSAPDPARRAAVDMMTAVTKERLILGDVMAKAVADLSPEQKARAGRLATEALRHAQKADRLLGPHLRLKPYEVILNVMRLALYEMNEAGVPQHAAVDAAVALAPKQAKGLTNGVLRNVLRKGAAWDALPVPTLPKWLRKRLIAAYGKAAVAEMEAVQAKIPPLDITLKDRTWAEALGGNVLPTGTMRLEAGRQVSALPGFDEGGWWVQDAAAALPARALEARSGERVLDLCAAPGGKTMQLAAAGAQVTALDISERRMARVEENLARTALAADIVVADALDWRPDTPFDAVLVDAPCSATGTLRRHPDLAFAKADTDFSPLLELQAAMLDRALDWTAPGGRVVYCTCSLLPEEGEAQIAALLERRSDVSLEMPQIEGVPEAWRVAEGLRTRPDYWADIGGMDGFFITRVRKER